MHLWLVLSIMESLRINSANMVWYTRFKSDSDREKCMEFVVYKFLYNDLIGFMTLNNMVYLL